MLITYSASTVPPLLAGHSQSGLEERQEVGLFPLFTGPGLSGETDGHRPVQLSHLMEGKVCGTEKQQKIMFLQAEQMELLLNTRTYILLTT